MIKERRCTGMKVHLLFLCRSTAKKASRRNFHFLSMFWIKDLDEMKKRIRMKILSVKTGEKV